MDSPQEKILTYKDLKPRYNNIGEWAPLCNIYNRDTSVIHKELLELTKEENDKRIYGALFYIKITSCEVIEFILKTHFEIPTDFQQIGSQYGKIHLHKINVEGEGHTNIENAQIYDCTLELVGSTVEDIKDGLQFIDATLHRIAFRLDTKIQWFMKYMHHSSPNNIIHLNDENMEVLKKYLVEELKGKDSTIIDVAISWYINGNNSDNVFIKFLSYCISMESLVDYFLDGKMDISKKFGVKEQEIIEKEIKDCIEEKYNQLYKTDPINFVKSAYFECVIGIEKRLRKSMEIVFGESHKYIGLFFDKINGHSIYGLRSKLAHGALTTLDLTDRDIIEKRLSDLKQIAFDFILRLSTGTQSNEKVKYVRPQMSISISFSNPRGTGIASNLDIYPIKDWKIKAEWLV